MTLQWVETSQLINVISTVKTFFWSVAPYLEFFQSKVLLTVAEIVPYPMWAQLKLTENDAGVEDDDGPNNNPLAKAAYPFPFRSADAWHMVHRHPAELDLAGLLSKGSRQ